MSELTITSTTTATRHVVTAAGALDHRSAARLREAIAGVPLGCGHHLVLDLSSLAFCDSSGLTVFIGAHERAEAEQAAFSLVGPPPPVHKMLRLTGLDTVLTVLSKPAGLLHP
ncbi:MULTISPECIES: STAS domain-containing protein [Actinosynnema]|uniref:STAS domain-containing protein n=1 Tax=Actinosynnema TaxID=40566 RepID=UPI0020A3C933|nr:STAS domain-containing protein [Actinosynnema pretiosum]MCP2098139.1 anti-anti-sigma factor [Actinosynnema pretiosum]